VNISAPEVVAARGISKIFGTGAAEFTALDDVSLSVGDGQFISVVGPSGCGKSTLLQIVAGLAEATRGEVLIDGARITGPQPDKIGVVFQEPFLLPWKTAVENIEFPLALRHEPARQRRQRAQALLDFVGLHEAAGLYPHQLSGGMKQRVAIARGLARNPRVLLMDEPFAALDEQTRTRMWGELLDIWTRGRSTILFVTHSLIEAVYLADAVVVMASRPGRIIERIEIGLPRPRTADMVGSDALGQVRNRIWNLIAGPQP
jgi:NitT/TauT family transport system ATP-binding protein